MRKLTRAFLLATGILLLFTFSLHAQNHKLITGKIIDNTGGGIVGATVTAKPSGKSVISGGDGAFSLQVSDKDKLYITSIGYSDKTVDIGGQTEFVISMQPSTTELAPVVMVGSRSGGRVKTETPVPVDVINVAQVGQTTGKMDVTSLLNMAAPSFNYNKQSGSDGADAIDLASLRGLGPDQTLVLINGKRQHQTAFVAIFGTRGRGNSGTDLNAIPSSAIERVEVLRDGASAQYGSDAIAGVINIILKKSIKKLNVTGGISGYYDPTFNPLNSIQPSQYVTGHHIDGRTASLGIDYGLPIGKNGGYINLAGNFYTQGMAFRQVKDTNVATNPKALPINNVRRANGDGSVTSFGAMLNSEIPIAHTKTKFYYFGGYNFKNTLSYAYSRNYSQPQRFPSDGNGNLIFVPGIMHWGNGNDSSNLYYNPQERVHITDASLAAGLKGTTQSNWNWDISNTLGGNNFHYYGEKTFNVTIVGQQGADKTHFDDGGFYFLQNTTNVDISKHFASVAKGLTTSFGAEYRYERYSIYAGEPASYHNYDTSLQIAGAYAPGGAQGFNGFMPNNDTLHGDAVRAHRNVVGAYAELDLDVTDRWLVEGAARFEHYSDFGSQATFKFDTRYKVTDNFNLRGSISTGFRAPSLQQIYFSTTFTNVQGGFISTDKIAPNGSDITQAAGIPKLKQETSVNASLGFTYKPIPNLSFTVDGYLVKVKNRIVLSGQFDTSVTELAPLLNAQRLNYAQFFANAVNTTNYGLDFVVNYNTHWSNQHFNALLAGNIQHMDINKINIPPVLNNKYEHQQMFFSDREQYYLKASAPPIKTNLNLEYGVNKFAVGTHFTYYGKIKILGYGFANTYPPLVPLDSDPKTTVLEQFVYKGKVVSDLYFSYKLSRAATFFIGSDNIFNVHPDLGVVPSARYSAYDGEAGGPWDPVQMGIMGRKLYARIAINL